MTVVMICFCHTSEEMRIKVGRLPFSSSAAALLSPDVPLPHLLHDAGDLEPLSPFLNYILHTRRPSFHRYGINTNTHRPFPVLDTSQHRLRLRLPRRVLRRRARNISTLLVSPECDTRSLVCGGVRFLDDYARSPPPTMQDQSPTF